MCANKKKARAQDAMTVRFSEKGGEVCTKVPIKVSMAGFMMFLVAACSDSARVPEESTFGPNPILPEPNETLIRTVNIAPAKGWPADAKPIAAPGLSVSAYATGLDHPRWLYVLPKGDVFVAETNGPPRPEDGRGIRGWIYQLVQSWVGAGVPSANRITLLRDADGDGEPHAVDLGFDSLAIKQGARHGGHAALRPGRP